MVTIIKKGISKKTLQERIRKIKSRRKLNALKYCGVIKVNGNALQIQKSLRNEWN
jgi:hypothetical protein